MESPVEVGKMAALQRRMIGSTLSGVTMIVAMTFLLIPQAAFSENVQLFPIVEAVKPEVQKVEKANGKRMTLGTDDDGNVMVRYGRVSLTMVYGQNESTSEVRERVGLVSPPRESIGIGEVSCKLGLRF